MRVKTLMCILNGNPLAIAVNFKSHDQGNDSDVTIAPRGFSFPLSNQAQHLQEPFGRDRRRVGGATDYGPKSPGQSRVPSPTPRAKVRTGKGTSVSTQ